MIKDAVLAGIPVVSVRTRDMINFPNVVKHITGQFPVKYEGNDPAKNTLYFMSLKGKQVPSMGTLYKKFASSQSTIIMCNPEKPIIEAFDAGDLETPRALIQEVLLDLFTEEASKATDAEKEFVSGLLPGLGGLTLKEVAEVIKLTQVREDVLSSKSITKTRQLLVPDLSGLSQVNTDLPVYIPNPAWAKFTAENKAFFLGDYDPRLVPRGVLLDGDPGTGKTQGMKYLAGQWGIPLYRIAADFQSKWVGESESNLQSILSRAAQEEPCALLIDEVEKLFNKSSVGSGSSGVTSKAMSLLLWFMQENPAKVFVGMTCNNKEVIPPELYREGRVSGTITFVGLQEKDAFGFGKQILTSFKLGDNADLVGEVTKAIHKLYVDGQKDRIAHSRINELVTTSIREFYIAAAASKEPAVAA